MPGGHRAPPALAVAAGVGAVNLCGGRAGRVVAARQVFRVAATSSTESPGVWRRAHSHVGAALIAPICAVRVQLRRTGGRRRDPPRRTRRPVVVVPRRRVLSRTDLGRFRGLKKPRKPCGASLFSGGRGRDRTRDTLIKSQLLYQLSYTPTNW